MEKEESAFQRARREAREQATKELREEKELAVGKIGTYVGNVEAKIKEPISSRFLRAAAPKGDGKEKMKPFSKFRAWSKKVADNLDKGGKNEGVLGKDSVLLQQTKGQSLADGSFWKEQPKAKQKLQVKQRVVTTYK